MSETHADARTDAIFRQQTFFACFATNGVETGGSEKLGIAETLRSGGERESEREMVGRWVGWAWNVVLLLVGLVVDGRLCLYHARRTAYVVCCSPPP